MDEPTRRRLVEGRAGVQAARLAAAMRARDAMDRSRAEAPAVVPPGAVRVRASGDIDALADRLVARLRRGGRGRRP